MVKGLRPVGGGSGSSRLHGEILGIVYWCTFPIKSIFVNGRNSIPFVSHERSRNLDDQVADSIVSAAIHGHVVQRAFRKGSAFLAAQADME